MENFTFLIILSNVLNVSKFINFVIKKGYKLTGTYLQDSIKLIETGFKKLYVIDNSIYEIINALKSRDLKNAPKSYPIKWMKELDLK